jgi:hypothetical protein
MKRHINKWLIKENIRERETPSKYIFNEEQEEKIIKKVKEKSSFRKCMEGLSDF